MTFTSELLLEGKTATGIVVPASYVDELGGGKRPPVVVTLAGRYTYRSTVMPYAGKPMLPVSAEHRLAAGLEAGQRVEVTLVLDTEPRLVEVPDEVAAALKENPAAAGAFEKLAPSQKRALVEGVTSAKTPETRQKRLEKILALGND